MRPERAFKCPRPLSQTRALGAPGPSAHPLSPGFRRRRPVNPSFPAVRGLSEGARDGCRIRAGEPRTPGRDRSSKVAANRPRNRRCPRVVVPQPAPYPARAGAGRTSPSPPALGSSLQKGAPARPDSGMPGLPSPAGGGGGGGERSLRRGADGFCLSGRRRRPPQKRGLACQARAQATSH